MELLSWVLALLVTIVMLGVCVMLVCVVEACADRLSDRSKQREMHRLWQATAPLERRKWSECVEAELKRKLEDRARTLRCRLSK